MRLLPCGDRALLVEFETGELARGAFERWVTERPEGLLELVPAARTVLVRIDPAVLGLGHAEHWLREHPPVAARQPTAKRLELVVDYDGGDLDVVAAAWACSVPEVIDRHAATRWVCAFIGFSPGFAYLVPEPGSTPFPDVPRRDTSRSRVPAGSIALAAGYCGVYPRESPGGWQLIGRTDATLWNSARQHPALVTPGTRVRFTPATST